DAGDGGALHLQAFGDRERRPAGDEHREREQERGGPRQPTESSGHFRKLVLARPRENRAGLGRREGAYSQGTSPSEDDVMRRFAAGRHSTELAGGATGRTSHAGSLRRACGTSSPEPPGSSARIFPKRSSPQGTK